MNLLFCLNFNQYEEEYFYILLYCQIAMQLPSTLHFGMPVSNFQLPADFSDMSSTTLSYQEPHSYQFINHFLIYTHCFQ